MLETKRSITLTGEIKVKDSDRTVVYLNATVAEPLCGKKLQSLQSSFTQHKTQEQQRHQNSSKTAGPFYFADRRAKCYNKF